MAKKRANGEGNIRKRSDGRWEGRYTAGHDPVTSKRITKNVLGKTQVEVREKLRRTIEETRGLDVARAGEYTAGQWLEVWFNDYAMLKVRPSSHQTYRGYLDHHIKPYIGSIPLTKLSSLDLQRLYKNCCPMAGWTASRARSSPRAYRPRPSAISIRSSPPR